MKRREDGKKRREQGVERAIDDRNLGGLGRGRRVGRDNEGEVESFSTVGHSYFKVCASLSQPSNQHSAAT